MRIIFWRRKRGILGFAAALIATYLILYFLVTTGRAAQNHPVSWRATKFRELARKDLGQPQQNFVFIKLMKCGTQTLASILRRYAIRNNLNGVTPRKDFIYLGWPFPMARTDFRPSRQPFNALIDHAVYNPEVMHEIMPPNTVYFTIIREPFSHFKSTFNYFNVAEIAQINSTNPLREFVENVWKYEANYQSKTAKKRWCIPDNFSVARNLQSHCLGMPLGFPPGRENITSDTAAIQHYIRQLFRDFSFVMLMDYFNESLILLRRLMRWKIPDIVYLKTNVGNYKHKNDVDPALKRWHQEWSKADYLLYDFFNKTFWQIVSEQGADFHEEVTAFGDIQNQLSLFCQDEKQRGPLMVPESKWTDSFTIPRSECKLLTEAYRDAFMDFQRAKLGPEAASGISSVTQQGIC